jgi:hypothetical protein
MDWFAFETRMREIIVEIVEPVSKRVMDIRISMQ